MSRLGPSAAALAAVLFFASAGLTNAQSDGSEYHDCSCKCCEGDGCDSGDWYIDTFFAGGRDKCTSAACRSSFALCKDTGSHHVTQVYATFLDCECSCCNDDTCPDMTSYLYPAGSRDKCSPSHCSSRYRNCPDQGSHSLPDSVFANYFDCSCECCADKEACDANDYAISRFYAGSEFVCTPDACRANSNKCKDVGSHNDGAEVKAIYSGADVGTSDHSCQCSCCKSEAECAAGLVDHTYFADHPGACTEAQCSSNFFSCPDAGSHNKDAQVFATFYTCKCECCKADDCPNYISNVFLASSAEQCSEAQCSSRFASCPDAGSHNDGSSVRAIFNRAVSITGVDAPTSEPSSSGPLPAGAVFGIIAVAAVAVLVLVVIAIYIIRKKRQGYKWMSEEHMTNLTFDGDKNRNTELADSAMGEKRSDDVDAKRSEDKVMAGEEVSGITCTDDGSRYVLQISLNRQKLAGSLPEAWSGLASLRSLQLKLNYALTGTLPASWSALTALDSLLANDNLLGGTVPAEWSAMSSLTKLHLHNNMLHGPLPESFGNLVSMQIMLLGRNCFTGTLPTQWSGMTALEKLGLQWHLLTGSLPPEMSHLKALTSLDLSGYDITAATSCVPVLKSHSIRVSDNCSSPSAGGGATEEGTPEAVPPMRCVMPGLRGFLPPAWSALSSLSSLEASHNALSGSLPLSWTALLDLAQLALDDNRLSGTLPTDWTALRVLTRLKLNHNANVTGTLPSSWARLSWLQELSLSECQLTGTVPTEWAGMPALEDLSLGGNFLSGQVPTYLSEAPALAFINVSHNLFLLPEEEWVQPGGRFGSQLWVMEPQRVGFGRMLEITNDPTGDGHGVPVSGDSDDATGTLPGTVASEKEQGGGGGPNDSVLYAIFGCVVGVLVITAVTFVEIRRRKRQVIQSSAVAVGYPLIGSNRQGDLCIRRPTLMKKVSLQEKENVVFEELSQPVQDLHEGMAEELRSRPLRLLTADFVRNCVSLPCYEELEAQGTRQPLAFVEVPYSETEQDLHWDRTAVVSWRWGAPKPETLLRGFSPMTDLQLQELRRYLSVKDEVEYVWVDWCCVPQYSSSPMFEIARSKLFYSRAAKMIILPIAKPLPEGNLRVVLAHAVRALSRGVPGQHQKEDEVMAAAVLQDIRRRGLYSDFGYFGRVWTLAERMARHGRGECLQNWVSLESWIAMTVDALWLSSAEEGADDSPGLQFYWGRLFDPQKARATIQTLRLVRQRGSALAADTHSTEVAQLLVEAVRVWQNGSVTEALDVEWLKNYLQNEAGRVYESWHPEDGVWSIYTFFCWHTRESFPAAHQDLCLLAGLDPRLSQLWPVVQAVQTSLSPEPRSPPVRNTPPGKEDMNYLRLPQLDTPQSELHPRRTVRGRLSNMFRSRRIDDPPSEASSSYSRPATAMRVRRTTGGGLHPNNSSLSDVVPRELEFQEEPSDQEAAQQGAAISSGTRRVSTPTSPFSTQLQLLQAEEEADCETPTRAEICCALPGTVSSAASPPQAPTKSRSKKQRWSFV